MKTDTVYAGHILDAIAQIEAYTQGMEAAAFATDRLRQDAVMRQLEIIGEAARRLSEAFKAQHATVPWRAVIGMRNRLAHDYIHVDVQIVWEVVQYDLPVLRAALEEED